MKAHVRNFLVWLSDIRGYTVAPGDFLPCAVCGSAAVDLHHIQPKGMGGRANADCHDNIVPLCRDCHTKAHAGRISKAQLRLAKDQTYGNHV